MTIQELIKQYAEEKGLPEKEVHQLIMGWLELTKISMNKLEYLNIELPGAGVFTMKHWKAHRVLAGLTKKRNSVSVDRRHWYNKGIQTMERAIRLSEEEEARKEETKKRKAEYKNKRK
jgi:nucleoid DNA-binding protein